MNSALKTLSGAVLTAAAMYWLDPTSGRRRRVRLRHMAVHDAVLAERVRESLGRVVSHPGAIDLTASDGRVELTGDVLAREYPHLLRAVHAVRGVIATIDCLSVHGTADHVSALRDGRPCQAPRFERLQQRWSPAAWLLTSAAVGALLFYGVRHRGSAGFSTAAAGAALLARSATNRPFRQLAGRRARLESEPPIH